MAPAASYAQLASPSCSLSDRRSCAYNVGQLALHSERMHPALARLKRSVVWTAPNLELDEMGCWAGSHLKLMPTNCELRCKYWATAGHDLVRTQIRSSSCISCIYRVYCSCNLLLAQAAVDCTASSFRHRCTDNSGIKAVNEYRILIVQSNDKRGCSLAT
jgi:hypothetical protein